MTEYRIVKADRLRSLTVGIFSGLGMPQADAEKMGDILVDADLRGVFSHGTRFVPTYTKWIRDGWVNLNPQIRVVAESTVTAAFEADDSLGHLVSVKAMEHCIKKAKEHGIGAATVANARHCGAMAYYSQMAADAGCIGHAVTNGGVLMAPYGGIDPTIGLNPLSWAVPSNKPWSVNLDMATAVVAASKVTQAIEKGEKIPLGWAIDHEGNPTDDPYEAKKGAMLPLGGVKGYGLAIILDVLSGVLSGGRFGANQGLEKYRQKEQNYSHFFMAIDVEKFMPLKEFKDRMDQLIERLKAGRLAPGSTGILLPGEIEYNNRVRHMAEGISYPVVILDQIEQLAKELGAA
ncbi:MAG: Ldh family oxidoreductase [Chloroflexota bacterium]|jgi:LDH2 family malate/lactate/ureidoglycolate dehydrogenase